MTPAEKYIAGLYEWAVDAQLDLEAIRRHLAARGVRRSPAQVVDDLTHAYGFHGYADNHLAPDLADVAAFDAAIGY